MKLKALVSLSLPLGVALVSASCGRSDEGGKFRPGSAATSIAASDQLPYRTASGAPQPGVASAHSPESTTEAYLAKLSTQLRVGMSQPALEKLLDLFPDNVDLDPGRAKLRPSDPAPEPTWVVEYDLRMNCGITTPAQVGLGTIETSSSKYPRLVCRFRNGQHLVENSGLLGMPTKEEMARNIARAIEARRLVSWEIQRHEIDMLGTSGK